MSYRLEVSQDVQMRETWIEARRGRLFAKIWGEANPGDGANKPPIVLLHDSLGCVELWRDFPAHLSRAAGCAVIAYDRLGFGRSDPRPDRLDVNFIREEAQDSFAALIEQLGFRNFVALGHSVGGGMAVVVAGTFPGRCRALLTVSAQAFVEDRTLRGICEAKKNFMRPGQIDRLRKYHGDKAEWVLHAWTETWLSPEFAHWNLDEDLPKACCPVLVIHGDNDEYGSWRHPERIGALAAGPATIEILPECGHIPYLERKDHVVAMIATFLERNVS
jgi:pimeloyl-ACP methyl ester carboxylesterase